VAYGGRIFNLLPELRSAIPAHFLGETLEAAIGQVEILHTRRIEPPAGNPPSERDAKAARIFRQNQTLVNMHTVTALTNLALPHEYLITAIESLGDNLHSAISLGHLDALRIEFEWLRGLMQQHDVDQATLPPFVLAYADAVDKSMGKSGLYISNWLRGQFSQ
jgi:hypothetical protein